MPAAQELTVAAVLLGQALPGGHQVQLICPATAYVPAEQAIGLAALSGHLEPAGQVVQATADAAEYCPAEQATGEPLLAHAKPAGQATQTVFVASTYSPAAHCTGAADALAHYLLSVFVVNIMIAATRVASEPKSRTNKSTLCLAGHTVQEVAPVTE